MQHFLSGWGITPHNNYDLQVLISTDGGLNFEDTIWTELSTDTSAWSSWQWVRAEIDMAPYLNESDIQLCFRYVGYDGADAVIDNIEISFVTGLEELISHQLKLYPNPASEFFTIETKCSGTVKVHDLSGKLVLQKEFSPETPQIDISNLNPGYYSVLVKNKKNGKELVYPLIIN